MDLQEELKKLRAALDTAECVQAELDRRAFYMKTLYDLSVDLFSSVNSETITRAFLMMTMGNFGAMEGFVQSINPFARSEGGFVSLGFDEAQELHLRDWVCEVLGCMTPEQVMERASNFICPDLAFHISHVWPFRVAPDFYGLVGLGPKLTGGDYTPDDMELLVTLTNNLVAALRNARSFEEIASLAAALRARNEELSSALRKVEILEGIKSSLSKFVPNTVCRLLEESPSADCLESRDQDVSVLFVDVEGYTQICEKLGHNELNSLIERYFSVFMDAIYQNHGDVNETAGDGLMVIFHHQDERTNALQAARAALDIRRRARSIREGLVEEATRLVVNMGINSGLALVGAVKFESYTGSRWTYTARGSTTNIAARIGALATGGSIFLSGPTAERIGNTMQLEYRGKFRLKNVSEEIDIYAL